MFASSGSFHPATLAAISSGVAATNFHKQRSGTVEESALLTNSRSSSTLQRLTSIVSAADQQRILDASLSLSCNRLILSALQGQETDYRTRTQVANALLEMDDTQKRSTIDYVKNELMPHSMENNACKAFNCNRSELTGPQTSDRVHRLVALWDTLYTIILPNVESMLFPLQSFNTITLLLSAFRDRALLPVVADQWTMADWNLRSMLSIVHLHTHDDTLQYRQLKTIVDRCIPNPTIDSSMMNS